MIRLNNISRTGDVITCEALLEDCETAIQLSYNIEKMDFAPFAFPAGYEYCRSHIAHARAFLRDNYEDLPEATSIHWY